jgi:hypothetical protein
LAARSSLGGVPVPTITMLYLRRDEEDLAFNTFKWALAAKSRYELPAWAFTAHTDEYKVVGAARVLPERMVQVCYEDPDRSQRFCANSEIADLGLEVFRRDRNVWRHIESLSSLKRAHLQFGRRVPFVELPVSF